MSGTSFSLVDLLPEADPVLAPFAVTGIALDSRKVQPGDLFLALPGTRAHGNAFVEQALARGAHAVALDADAPGFELRELENRRVPLVQVAGLRERVGAVADRFYGHPSRELTVIGVTGTNGKSSVTHFIAEALSRRAPCGLIGTLGSGLMGALRDTGHTTPDPITLHAELAELHRRGARAAVMEVSSHALDQGRVNGVAFDVAVFTNLSHDHLDYHGDMQSYAAAKRRLLAWPGLRGLAVNLDDPVGRQWQQEFAGSHRVIGFTCDETTAAMGGELLRAHALEFGPEGIAFEIESPFGGARVKSALLGRFNVSNLLAALAALLLAGVPFADAVERLAAVRTVPGRMERFDAGGDAPIVVVDYAHSPDALDQVLHALRDHLCGERRLWCVFGCGGDRDRLKRPLMGRIAEQAADYVVLTDDNPRSENPYAIIEAIQQGMRNPDAAYVVRERAAAIQRAVDLAAPGDIVLVAGKGHETEQTIGGKRLPFSDRIEVARILGIAPHE